MAEIYCIMKHKRERFLMGGVKGGCVLSTIIVITIHVYGIQMNRWTGEFRSTIGFGFLLDGCDLHLNTRATTVRLVGA